MFLKEINDSIKAINRMLPSIPVQNQERGEQIVKNIVQQHAQGSIYLFTGKYITSKDMENNRAETIAFDFISPKRKYL